MASLPFMFIFSCLSLFVHGEVHVSNNQNLYENHASEVAAVLKHLNSSSFKVYNYKEATLLHAHTKADITELVIDVNVECLNNYPQLPCTEKRLTCHGFVQNTPDNGSQVLNEVNCTPKQEIIVDELPTNPTEVEANDTKSFVLSHEAASSEVGSEPFIAVHKDRAPCLGCPFDLNPNVEGVDELAGLALEHVGSERTHKQVLVQILRLQQQVVSGVKYILTAEIRPTLCLNDSPQDLSLCPLDEGADSAICEITFIQKPWISKAKHITSNNCTVSQEYVKPTEKKDEMNNEIDFNDKPTNPGLASPNFDQIAQTGAMDEMTPSRLSDLESQIIVDIEDVGSRKGEVQNQDLNPQAVVTQNVDYTSEIQNDTPFDPAVTDLELAATTDSFVPTTIITISDPKPTSSEESRDSSEEDGKLKSKDAKSSEESSESSESKTRKRRAIPQLEKISPEEKPLVKNLADFAAQALDNIDDDNHKRVILQILGAKKMVGDDGVYYHLIMRMGISHCLEDKQLFPYENCREKLFENYTKICKVQVFVNDDFGSPKIIKSQCQNIKRDNNDNNRTNYSRFKRQVPGGQTEISVNSDKVKNLLNLGITHLNAQRDGNKFKPVEVLSATTQVVAGESITINTKISETDCTKNDEKNLKDCNTLAGASPKTCEIKVWEKSWQNFRQFSIKCEGDEKLYKVDSKIRSKRHIPRAGGQFQVPENDKFVRKYLESGLSHLDEQSDNDNKYKVHEIVSATKQIVAGHIYRIKANIVVSDCKKTSLTKRYKCGALDKSPSKTCNFEVFEQLWVPGSRQLNITCDDEIYSFRESPDMEFSKLKQNNPHVSDGKLINKMSGFLGRGDSKLLYPMFADFITKYNKVYSKHEYKYRFKVFSQNILKIRVLNTYEQGTATYGITRFADMTSKEFSKSLGLRTDLRNDNLLPFPNAKIPDIKVPAEFDWRQRGVVTEVKDQKQCGSCWAFSVTGNVEGQYALKHGNLVEFSEQELVDCDSEDQGCNGGLMDTAYREIEKLGGLETEEDYPYDAEDEKCHFNRTLARVKLSGAVNISHDETDMTKWLVANGPISIAINANAMQFYFGGVSHPFKFLCDPTNLDHGVLIVGYGSHTYPLFNKTLPYWIVKNSWGKSWGEQGYYRVYRGDGTCGLNQTPSSAIVV